MERLQRNVDGLILTCAIRVEQHQRVLHTGKNRDGAAEPTLAEDQGSRDRCFAASEATSGGGASRNRKWYPIEILKRSAGLGRTRGFALEFRRK